MALGTARVRQYLGEADFKTLFLELGWDHYHARPMAVTVGGQSWTLHGVAQKRGLAVLLADPGPDGALPDQALRRGIERAVKRGIHEHIIIYQNAPGTEQVWQWVRRGQESRTAYREQRFVAGQTGIALSEKLRELTFTLDEEAELGITDVVSRVRAAFDVERVTKRFYERFKAEHTDFLGFVEGIAARGDREWYASVMLNRLMFVYFIQKKGFLDGDHDYLRHRLDVVRQERPSGFLSFYRYFLLRLFHDGLGGQARDAELERLLGKVPYLNGGLFSLHQQEEANPEIDIPDVAFERIFDFFDSYQWRLDERPLRDEREINPDVLGYIFEKYINQKQMGAYYTKEDITEYIGKNTIVPFLLDQMAADVPAAFERGGAAWRLLRENPDRYIYAAVSKGVDLPLPPAIAAGESDVQARGGWNRAADPDFALPTETWREHMARRARCHDLRAKLRAGEAHTAGDLITHNLDIRRYAQDLITYSEGPDLVGACYRAIERVTVLDPTCGSGAFLFAALNILEPLYVACLDRMQALVEEASTAPVRRNDPAPHGLESFRAVLERVATHRNRDYFVLKSIVLNNLYGVDIMEEAVEICKLRLFLKLAAQVEPDSGQLNYGLEPLPDIDFNIRAGNSLVGFATYDEVERAVRGGGDKKNYKFDLFDEMAGIEERARAVDRADAAFRAAQTELALEPGLLEDEKRKLRAQLAALSGELDRYLAAWYGVDSAQEGAFEQWRESHQPFHWFIEFHGIIAGGGFDVVIGNPPYVDYSKVVKAYRVRGYATESCGNLYGFVAERSFGVVGRGGRLGLILMLNLAFADGYESLRREIGRHTTRVWLSSYDNIPDGLFAGSAKTERVNTNTVVSQRVCIVLCTTGQSGAVRLSTSPFLRWNRSYRSKLFPTIMYGDLPLPARGPWPTLGSLAAAGLYRKLVEARGVPLGVQVAPAGPAFLQLGATPRYFISAIPEKLNRAGLIEIRFPNQQARKVAECVLNSTLFYWYWRATGDGFHLTRGTILNFPVPRSLLKDDERVDATTTLLADVRARCRTSKLNKGQLVHNVNYNRAPEVVAALDRLLAQHYSFSDEELDFIINYDIKYRMGRDADPEGEA